MKILWLIYLIVLGAYDIKYKYITRKQLYIGLLLLGIGVGLNPPDILGVLQWIGVALIFLGISRFSKESLGFGDSLIIILLTGSTSIKEMLFVLFMSFILCGGFGICLNSMKQYKTCKELPYIPFLAMGYIGGIFWM